MQYHEYYSSLIFQFLQDVVDHNFPSFVALSNICTHIDSRCSNFVIHLLNLVRLLHISIGPTSFVNIKLSKLTFLICSIVNFFVPIINKVSSFVPRFLKILLFLFCSIPGILNICRTRLPEILLFLSVPKFSNILCHI